MNKDNLVILSNEKIYDNSGYFCDNIDIKNLSEKLNYHFNVYLIGRKSNQKRFHKINIKQIKTHASIFSIFFRLKELMINRDSKYLIVSLSPFTFLALILLKIFNKKVFIYFRSDGFLEYKKIIGILGPIIYGVMFYISTKLSLLISCSKNILRGKKGYVILPSQLDASWHQNHKVPSLSKIKLIYVGRIKKEKGIFSLLSLIKEQSKINLTIVGAGEENTKIISKPNVNVLKIITNKSDLINLYDNNNITILPSYTEGYPMVILESLSRLRPVIVFKDIEHVVENRKGIFVSNRDYSSLNEKINYIMNNYNSIQESMKLNKLPDNESFINKLKEILNKKKFEINDGYII